MIYFRSCKYLYDNVSLGTASLIMALWKIAFVWPNFPAVGDVLAGEGTTVGATFKRGLNIAFWEEWRCYAINYYCMFRNRQIQNHFRLLNVNLVFFILERFCCTRNNIPVCCLLAVWLFYTCFFVICLGVFSHYFQVNCYLILLSHSSVLSSHFFQESHECRRDMIHILRDLKSWIHSSIWVLANSAHVSKPRRSQRSRW